MNTQLKEKRIEKLITSIVQWIRYQGPQLFISEIFLEKREDTIKLTFYFTTLDFTVYALTSCTLADYLTILTNSKPGNFYKVVWESPNTFYIEFPAQSPKQRKLKIP